MKSASVTTAIAIVVALVWFSAGKAAEKTGALFEKGKVLLGAGQYQQAVQVFSQVLQQVRKRGRTLLSSRWPAARHISEKET